MDRFLEILKRHGLKTDGAFFYPFSKGWIKIPFKTCICVQVTEPLGFYIFQ